MANGYNRMMGNGARRTPQCNILICGPFLCADEMNRKVAEVVQ